MEFADHVAFFDVDDAESDSGYDHERRPNRVPRAQRHVQESRRDGPVRGFPASWAPRSIPVPRSSSFELADGQEREISFRLGAGRNADDASQLVHRFRGSAALEAHSKRFWQYWNKTLGARSGGNAGPVPRRIGQRLAVVSNLACRLWARSGYYQSGRRLRFPRSVAGRDGADPCRARAGARAPAALRGASVPRRRLQHWGIRRRIAAYAPTVRTITCGCRWRPAAIFSAPATPACWMKPSLHRRPAGEPPTRTPITICRAARTNRQVCTNTACAPS